MQHAVRDAGRGFACRAVSFYQTELGRANFSPSCSTTRPTAGYHHSSQATNGRSWIISYELPADWMLLKSKDRLKMDMDRQCRRWRPSTGMCKQREASGPRPDFQHLLQRYGLERAGPTRCGSSPTARRSRCGACGLAGQRSSSNAPSRPASPCRIMHEMPQPVRGMARTRTKARRLITYRCDPASHRSRAIGAMTLRIAPSLGPRIRKSQMATIAKVLARAFPNTLTRCRSPQATRAVLAAPDYWCRLMMMIYGLDLGVGVSKSLRFSRRQSLPILNWMHTDRLEPGLAGLDQSVVRLPPTRSRQMSVKSKISTVVVCHRRASQASPR